MTFIDRFPGGTIAVANTLLYSVILLEIWMLTTASLVAMAAVMTIIIVMAALLCRFIMAMMGNEEYIAGDEPVAIVPAPAPAPAQVPAPAAVAPRRGAPVMAGARLR
jgi:hypothetical protein